MADGVSGQNLENARAVAELVLLSERDCAIIKVLKMED